MAAALAEALYSTLSAAVGVGVGAGEGVGVGAGVGVGVPGGGPLLPDELTPLPPPQAASNIGAVTTAIVLMMVSRLLRPLSHIPTPNPRSCRYRPTITAGGTAPKIDEAVPTREPEIGNLH
jgi:hypothetical protein